jgi:hypothetical protein
MENKVEKYIREICNIGQGEKCCRYLLMGSDGWECGKLNPVWKNQLDDPERRKHMSAQGDNCEGKVLKE